MTGENLSATDRNKVDKAPACFSETGKREIEVFDEASNRESFPAYR
jgi:hypothetical protein